MVMTAVTIETAKSLGEKYYSARYLPHPLLKPETSKIGPRQNYLVATTRACGNYYNDVSKSENSQGNRSCLQSGIQYWHYPVSQSTNTGNPAEGGHEETLLKNPSENEPS